ncbi:MAG: hypothetical protein KF696_00085 [Planctomycetes bacterium]|nr:hypothetical protein [Planctomycetota bacterium]MCW8134663.1 hypothetical protein [Planctomycetota bacterium]
MRNTLAVFLIGFVFGSSLGIGGLWTQVVQPTKDELQKIESENKIMQQAIDSATKALKDAAADLRNEGNIAPAGVTGPTGTQPQPAPDPLQPVRITRATRLAEDLDTKATELDKLRTDLRTTR